MLRCLAWAASSTFVVLSQGHAQTATVTPIVETDPVPSGGDAADDMVVWIHPSDRSLSTVIGTDKDSGMAVYDLDGTQLQFLEDGELNNVDVRYRFPLGAGEVALVTAGERAANVLAIYAVDPVMRTLTDVAVGAIPFGIEIYGSCMYRSPVTGDTYFFGNSKDGEVEQWRLFDAGGGLVDAELVRTLDVGDQTEGCVCDDEEAALYIGEEEVGIWRYGAEPGDGTSRTQIDSTGPGGNLTADVEGLTIYYSSDGAGYLIASSQGNNTFVVYERQSPFQYLLTFQIGVNSSTGIDAVSETDGIDVMNLALGSAFPGGVFVAQDGVNDPDNQNYKLVSWEDVACEVTPPLLVDTAYDVHGIAPCSQPLQADSTSLSVSAGGTQTFCLNAGLQNSGKEYLLLGTLSGSSPGFRFGGMRVPLNPDAYLRWTVIRPNEEPLVNSRGTLNSEGRATAHFVLPPGELTSLAGATLHHAYVVMDSPTAEMTSNRVRSSRTSTLFVSDPVATILLP